MNSGLRQKDNGAGLDSRFRGNDRKKAGMTGKKRE
jgi:hypothetical protein